MIIGKKTFILNIDLGENLSTKRNKYVKNAVPIGDNDV